MSDLMHSVKGKEREEMTQKLSQLLVGWRIRLLGRGLRKCVEYGGDDTAEYGARVESFDGSNHHFTVDLRIEKETEVDDDWKTVQMHIELLDMRVLDQWRMAPVEDYVKRPSGALCTSGRCVPAERSVYGTNICSGCLVGMHMGVPVQREAAVRAEQRMQEEEEQELGTHEETRYVVGQEVLVKIDAQKTNVPCRVLRVHIDVGRPFLRQCTCPEQHRSLYAASDFEDGSTSNLRRKELSHEQVENLDKKSYDSRCRLDYDGGSAPEYEVEVDADLFEDEDEDQTPPPPDEDAHGFATLHLTPVVLTVKASALIGDDEAVFDSEEEDEDGILLHRTYELRAERGSDDEHTEPLLSTIAVPAAPMPRRTKSGKKPAGGAGSLRSRQVPLVLKQREAFAPTLLVAKHEHLEVEPEDVEKDIKAVEAFMGNKSGLVTNTTSATTDPLPDNPAGAALVGKPLLEMHIVSGVTHDRTSNDSIRDTEATDQYHFGYTVADVSISNSHAIELVYHGSDPDFSEWKGQRIRPEEVLKLPPASRALVTRHPIVRLRGKSWVLKDSALGPMVARRMQRAWAFAQLKAGDDPSFKQRLDAMERQSQPATINLIGLNVDTKRRVVLGLGFSEEEATQAETCDEITVNPRIIAGVPITNGTINIATLAATTNVTDEELENIFVDLLKRHVDKYDYEYGVAFLDILESNLLGGLLEVDISAEEAEQLRNVSGVEVLEIEPRLHDPDRWGVARIEPNSIVIADLKRRPHVVLKGRPRAAQTVGRRHSVIWQCHEPMLAQLERGRRRPDVGYVPVRDLQLMVLNGELPFTEHEMKVMEDIDAWKRSRWATEVEGKPIATQQALKEAFTSHAINQGVNAQAWERRNKRVQAAAKAFEPIAAAVGPYEPAVEKLAAMIGSPGLRTVGALTAALKRQAGEAQWPAVLAAVEAVAKLPAQGNGGLEDRTARAAAAILTPGVVDSGLLVTLLSPEGLELKQELAEEEAVIANGYVPCAFPGGELGAQADLKWRIEHPKLSHAEVCLAVVMRVFICTSAWLEIVNSDGVLNALANKRDDQPLHAVLVAIHRRQPQQRLFKRRYQGTSVGPNVLAALTGFDWAKFSANTATARTWSALELEIRTAGGKGLQSFLGTKLLLLLALAGRTPNMVDDEAELGPGARVSVHVLIHLVTHGEWIPSHQIKPKLVPKLDASFDVRTWMRLTQQYLKEAKAFAMYWDKRVEVQPRLETLTPLMYAQFRAVLVKIVLESFLCEDLRRRNVRTSPTPHV